MKTLSYKILITGRVQQVGFRFYTQQQATNLGINGSVQNLPNGDVFILAYGQEISMLEFINLLHKGPSKSMVTNVDLKEIPFESLSSFKIDRY